MNKLKQLPQNIIGYLLTRRKSRIMYVMNIYETKPRDIKVYFKENFFRSAISLGDYIILDEVYDRISSNKLLESVKHEHGHQLQSIKFGWLYLLIIGLPSLCGNIFDRIFHKNWTYEKRTKWYFNQPWEKNADKLGKVTR